MSSNFAKRENNTLRFRVKYVERHEVFTCDCDGLSTDSFGDLILWNNAEGLMFGKRILQLEEHCVVGLEYGNKPSIGDF